MGADLPDGMQSPLARGGVWIYGPDSMVGTGGVQPESRTGQLLVSERTHDLDDTGGCIRMDKHTGVVATNTTNPWPRDFVYPGAQRTGVEVRDCHVRCSCNRADCCRCGHLSCGRSKAIPETAERHIPSINYPRIQPSTYSEERQFDESSTTDTALRRPEADLTPSQSSSIQQPATRPITGQQLINEVKGIYAGLVMVEKKCVEIVAQQSQSTKKLSDLQWKALVALHRTLLQEHHDFSSASQHPTASETLKKLAIKYAMPARMWRHGIHAFLELLRHRLPDSMEHLLSFLYLAYSMMALLKESVPSFVETWIDCLRDLARYRMAIEDIDSRDQEIWSNVTKTWYNKSATMMLDTQTSAMVPNYISSILIDALQPRRLTCSHTFASIDSKLATQQSHTRFDWSERSKIKYCGPEQQYKHVHTVQKMLAIHLGLAKLRLDDWELYVHHLEDVLKRQQLANESYTHLHKLDHQQGLRFKRSQVQRFETLFQRTSPRPDIRGPDSGSCRDDVDVPYVSLTLNAVQSPIARTRGRNTVPFMHAILNSLYELSFVPDAIMYSECTIPWGAICKFLNTSARSIVTHDMFDSDAFPPSQGGHGKQLPEDFLMRGMTLTRNYFDSNFFAPSLSSIDEDERLIEWTYYQVPRTRGVFGLTMSLSLLNFIHRKISRHFLRSGRRSRITSSWRLIAF